MTTGSPQLVRQWLLIKKLCVSQLGRSVAELADDLEVNAKTIRRDLTVFRDAGFPLEESTGPSGRKSYRITHGARLPELSFAYDEALALYLGRRHLEPLAGTFVWEAAQRAFCKIEASLGPTAIKYLGQIANAFHDTRFGLSDYSAHAEIIDQLLLGIEDRKVVFMTYRSQRSTEPVTYDVHPYCLSRHRDVLYLIGFKPEDDAFRTWKVNRIEAATVDRMPFTRRDDFCAEDYLAGSLGVYHETGNVDVVIRFSPQVARYVEESRWHSSQQCEREPDGYLQVQFKLSGTTELKSWVLGFGRHAEVLEPILLRTEIQNELVASLESYAKTSDSNAQAKGNSSRRQVR